MYGSINQKAREMSNALYAEGKLTRDRETGVQGIKSLYKVSYPFDGNDVLIQAEAIPECMPHLMTWAPVTVPREGKLGMLYVSRIIGKYLANMTDEEIALVAPRIHYLFCFQEINAIDTYNECAIVHCHINGKPYSLTITVMNMIPEIEEGDSMPFSDATHWHRRESLN